MDVEEMNKGGKEEKNEEEEKSLGQDPPDTRLWNPWDWRRFPPRSRPTPVWTDRADVARVSNWDFQFQPRDAAKHNKIRNGDDSEMKAGEYHAVVAWALESGADDVTARYEWNDVPTHFGFAAALRARLGLVSVLVIHRAAPWGEVRHFRPEDFHAHLKPLLDGAAAIYTYTTQLYALLRRPPAERPTPELVPARHRRHSVHLHAEDGDLYRDFVFLRIGDQAGAALVRESVTRPSPPPPPPPPPQDRKAEKWNDRKREKWNLKGSTCYAVPEESQDRLLWGFHDQEMVHWLNKTYALGRDFKVNVGYPSAVKNYSFRDFLDFQQITQPELLRALPATLHRKINFKSILAPTLFRGLFLKKTMQAVRAALEAEVVVLADLCAAAYDLRIELTVPHEPRFQPKQQEPTWHTKRIEISHTALVQIRDCGPLRVPTTRTARNHQSE